MAGIVRMAVAQFWNHGFEGVEHVEVGAGIEIGGGERGCGVEDQEIADSCCLRVIRLEQSLHGFSDVKNLTFLAGFEGDPLHDGRGNRLAVVAFFATTSPKSLSS